MTLAASSSRRSGEPGSAVVYRPNADASPARARRALTWLQHLPARVAVGLIRVYQVTLSPALPILTLGRCGCRFAPTCSHYAATAVQTHGLLRGTALAVVRLLKCTPLHPGGFDPVPPRRARPVCQRAEWSAPSPASQP